MSVHTWKNFDDEANRIRRTKDNVVVVSDENVFRRMVRTAVRDYRRDMLVIKILEEGIDISDISPD